MTNITPEMLKVIAEGMGYRITKDFNFFPKANTVYIGLCAYPVTQCKEYNPLTNAGQLLEVMVKLHMLTQTISDNVSFARTEDMDNWIKGTTINEAVCNAAFKYFNDEVE